MSDIYFPAFKADDEKGRILEPEVEQYLECSRCQGSGEVPFGIIDYLEVCPDCGGEGTVDNPDFEPEVTSHE